MNKKYLTLMIVFIIGLFLFHNDLESKRKTREYVPNEEIAIKVAKVILEPIFEDCIEIHNPYKAELDKNGIWHVYGSLPEGYRGGVPHIFIQKKDCKVIKVYHTK